MLKKHPGTCLLANGRVKVYYAETHKFSIFLNVYFIGKSKGYDQCRMKRFPDSIFKKSETPFIHSMVFPSYFMFRYSGFIFSQLNNFHPSCPIVYQLENKISFEENSVKSFHPLKKLRK